MTNQLPAGAHFPFFGQIIQNLKSIILFENDISLTDIFRNLENKHNKTQIDGNRNYEIKGVKLKDHRFGRDLVIMGKI